MEPRLHSPANPWLTMKEARHALTTGLGRGVRIAVLDTGVDTTHPKLDGLTLRDDLAVVDDGVQLRVVPGEGADAFGHGTAIVGVLRQLAPEAEIGSFRVLGSLLRARTPAICEGVKLAIERGYHILNCSFGCSRADQVLLYKEWIDDAYVKGRHIVAACNNADLTRREWPGHFPTVLTVNFIQSAVAETLFHRPGTLVEFSARGQDIEVPWVGGGVKRVTGSSFAVPHVAGLLARLLSAYPDLPPLEAKSLLKRLAEPEPRPSKG